MAESAKEFDGLPGALLFTTNCLMPPKDSYRDRVFTTEVVAFPGCVHIEEMPDGSKDFSPVIEKALALGGFAETMEFTGINGGKEVTTGFSHAAILSHADTVVEAVREGKSGTSFGGGLRRGKARQKLLHRVCKTDAGRLHCADTCLR